jgi:ribonuclease-3
MKDFCKHIPEIENKIGYTFRDKSLLKQAFTRGSYCNEINKREHENYKSNEVLEFFGDSVLSAAIVTALIKKKTERYSHGISADLNEGDFSNIRSKLADKKNLSDNISRLGLEEYLIMGEGDKKLEIWRERSVREDLFEALIGAIYIDSEFNTGAVISSVVLMLDLSVYLSKERSVSKSAKNALQEWCADKRRRLPPPEYRLIGEEGPDHDKLYTVEVSVDSRILGRGKGRNVKAAESAAAERALEAIANKRS